MPVVDVDDLTVRYGDVTAVAELSFGVETGEMFGFLGPNGAGKTTTIRTLMGLLSPTAGTATVLGADVRDEQALVEAKRWIGYLPASLSFDEELTGERILRYLLACAGVGLVCSVFVDRADVANRLALGAVFGLFLVDSVTAVADDYAWIDRVSPMRHYDPTEVLVHGSYDLAGVAVLLTATAGLLAVSVWQFRRRDVGA